MEWKKFLHHFKTRQGFVAIIGVFILSGLFYFLTSSQFAQTQNQISLLEEKNHGLEEKIKTLEKEKNIFSAKAEFLEKQLMSQTNEKGEIYNQGLKLQEKVELLEKENQELSKKYADFKNTYEKIQKEKEIMGEEAYSLKFKLENQERFSRQIMSEKDQVMEELLQEKKKNQGLEIVKSELENKLSDAGQKLREMNKNYLNAKQSNLELLSSIELIKSDKKNLESKISYLKSRLDKANSGYEDLGLKKNELANKNEYLSSQFDILKDEINRLKIENERLVNNSYSSNYILPVSRPKEKKKVPQLAKKTKPVSKKMVETKTLTLNDDDLNLASQKDLFDRMSSAPARLPTSEKAEDNAESEYKNKLALKIKDALKKVSSEFDTDEDSVSVTLQLGKGLFFEKNSDRLGPEMKQKLIEVFNVYTKALFTDEDIASTVEKVIVVGHAGPILNGLFVDPNNESTTGFIYNKNLSQSRAKNIVDWLKEVDAESIYALDQLIEKIEFVGEGVKNPILKDQNKILLRKKYGRISSHFYNDPELVKTPGCGIFSCVQSRRIELRIKFSEDSGVIKKALEKVSLPSS